MNIAMNIVGQDPIARSTVVCGQARSGVRGAPHRPDGSRNNRPDPRVLDGSEQLGAASMGPIVMRSVVGESDADIARLIRHCAVRSMPSPDSSVGTEWVPLWYEIGVDDGS